MPSNVELTSLAPVIRALLEPLTENQDSVKSRATTTPPGSPADGVRYIVPAGATGLWLGQVGLIAHYVSTAWAFLTPTEGTSVWVDDEDLHVTYNGSTWQLTSITELAAVAPPSVAAANDQGVSTAAARADHTHAHGTQAGGTAHAGATTSVAGFMSTADKTKLDGLTGSQAAVDAAQQAAIDAQAALNTAQASAISAAEASNAAQDALLTANAALDTSQAAAITSNTSAITAVAARATAIEAQLPNAIHLDVRRYVPAGQVLNNSNFQDAIEAAILDAYAKTAAMTNVNAHYTAGYAVLIPEGIWLLTRYLRFPATGIGGVITPALLGAGTMRTKLLPGASFTPFTDTLTGYTSVIRVGGDYGDADASHSFNWEIGNLTIEGRGGSDGNLIGIHGTLMFHPHLHDLHIEGFQNAGLDPARCCGIRIDNAVVDGPGTRPNQHVRLTNVWVQNCVIGGYFRSCGPLNMYQCTFNQNLLHDIVGDGVSLSMVGGTLQGGGDYGTNYAFRSTVGNPRIVSGWGTTVVSGTTASVATTAAGETVVSGLAELEAALGTYSIPCGGYWLELEKASAAYDGSDKVSGRYLVLRRVAGDTVAIRKESNHALTTGVVWRLRHGQANTIDVASSVYHEGNCHAVVGSYVSGSTYSRVRVADSTMTNATVIVEGIGNETYSGPSMAVERCIGGAAFRARWAWSAVSMDQPYTVIGDLDEYSREGLICRDISLLAPSYAKSNTPGGLYSATVVNGGRLRNACRAEGANCILDPRVTSSLSVAGADLTSITDLINGRVFALVNATKYPQYSASDAAFLGQPSITLTGGTGGNACGLSGTILAASWPSVGHRPSMLVIWRTPSASVAPVGRYRRVVLTDGSSAHRLIVNETSLENVRFSSNTRGSGQTSSPAIIAPDTVSHATIIGGAGRAGLMLDSENEFSRAPDLYDQIYDGWVASTTKTLWLGTDAAAGDATDTLTFVYAATFPHGLPYRKRQHLMDLAANEFGIVGR